MEGSAAALAPLHLLLTVLLITLPFVSVVVAELERTRSARCGADVVAGRTAAGSWSTWINRRLREAALWRIDVPVAAVSLAIGVIEVIVLLLGLLASVTMLLAPAFFARGIGVVVGPWEVRSWPTAWSMTAVSVIIVAAVAGLLGCGSFLRDAVLRVLGRSDAVELRRQLDVVRANRARIVEGFEGERRRIERDLHDGVQQDLVALSITLGLLDHIAETFSGPEAEKIRRLSSRAQSEVDIVTTRLRDIVQGIHPRELTDHGLLAGVRQLCTRSPIQVKLRQWGDDGDVPLHVASAVYYAVSELLTNVARHAGVDRAIVDLQVQDGEIIAAVADEGVGGVDSGLDGLQDRIAGVDGTMMIDSPPGTGTAVTIRVPIGAPGHVPERSS